jgi:predicted ATPase
VTPGRPVRDRLPVNPTPLIGRQQELAKLGQLLADPACRLLTLVGPGGVGKTRLAIRAARQAADSFADGAAFVPLAPLTSPSYIVPAIAEALGFAFSGSAGPQTQLAHYLRDKQLLLVLDNVEHLLAEGGAELVAGLRECAADMKLLVTSREVLDLQGEWVFEVDGLPVPERWPTGAEGEDDAVELFLQRARRAQVGLTPTDDDYGAIVRICQRVEGLPLAIELAAAWVRVISCVEIAQQLESAPEWLAVSGRDVPARHRSLQAVFDHSWKLLSAPEQQALAKLAVFRGGFSREAAERVAEANLSLLSALMAKSLVRRSGTGRYDLHELIRQHARDRLREAGAEDLAREAHAAWFLAFARTAKPHMYTPMASAWLNDIEQEHHNVREVLHWALEAAPVESAANRIATGLGLMCALVDFFFVRGHHHEALAFFAQLLARPESMGSMKAGVEALTQTSYFYYLQGRFAEAHAALDEAFEHNRALGDGESLARGLEYRGLLASAESDYATARAALEQSLAVWRELKAGFQQAGVLSQLGDIALAQRDFDLAEHLYSQAIDPGAEMPDVVQHPYPPRRLAYLVLRRGDCDQAVTLVHQSLRLNLAIDDRRAVAACLTALASVAQVQGQLVRAARLFGAAEAILISIAAMLLPADSEEYDRSVEALRTQLSETDLAAAWAEGRSLSLAQAVDYALQAE